jgi:hypothetical protein
MNTSKVYNKKEFGGVYTQSFLFFLYVAIAAAVTSYARIYISSFILEINSSRII